MILIDGKKVPADQLDPAKHKFIGTFREPHPPDPCGCVFVCDCGQHLHTIESVYNHWQKGHFDLMQYVTIKNP